MLEEVDDRAVSDNKPPEGSKGLAEGSHRHIGFLLQAKVAFGPPPALADTAARMGVVHHYSCVVLFGNFDEIRKIKNLARRAENTIRHDQFRGGERELRNDRFQVLHVVVFVANNDLSVFIHHCPGAVRDQVTSHYAGVIVLVGDDILARLDERWNNPLGGLESRAVKKTVFLPHEFRETSLKFHVQIERPREIA